MYNENLIQKYLSGWVLALIVAASITLAGCAGSNVAEQETAAEEVPVDTVEATSESGEVNEVDPYEGFNRKMYVFNDKLDTYVAKPISDAYLWVTPQFVQTGIANFFSNLKDINVVLNDVMQGKLQQGMEDTGRFTVNSTVGLLGLFDVATEMGLEKHEEDFDQTLAVWGVPEGPYLVLPVLGPTTSRGIPGSVFDTAANPTTYVGLPVQLVSMLNSRANAEGALKFIDEAALDPYVFTRESFLQYRRHLVSDGQTEITEDTLDLEEEFYDDEEEGNGDSSQLEETTDKVENSDAATGQKLVNGGAEEELAEASGYSLKLSADTQEFDRASGSFDSAVESFDDASRSFAEAAEKLDRLERK